MIAIIEQQLCQLKLTFSFFLLYCLKASRSLARIVPPSPAPSPLLPLAEVMNVCGGIQITS